MLGVFDSGFGGLTVLRAIHERLPNVSTVYLGDNARAPYGTRTHEEIFQFTLDGIRELFRRDCPLVIVACNTSSAQALRQIQQTILPAEFPDRRVLGVIRPTAEEIVSMSSAGHIGVFATTATVSSGAYLREIEDASVSSPRLPSFRKEGLGVVRVSQVACPGLVDLIETGRERSIEADELVAKFCDQLIAVDPLVDTILLGCTHYPLVENLFTKHLANRRVISQGTIVADKLVDYLDRHPEIDARVDQTGSREYLTTKSDDGISSLASRFYGADVRFGCVELANGTKVPMNSISQGL